MRDTMLLAALTFREAARRRILLTALVLGAVYVALYGVGFYFIHKDFARSAGSGANIALESGFSFVVMAGIYVVSFLGIMLAVLTSVGTLSGEVSSHTIQCIASKPIRRSSIVLGKWLGLAVMIVAYVLLLGGGIALVTYSISGYMMSRLVEGLLLVAFQAVIMLTISVLGGTRLGTIANGVVAFMLYGLAFIGGWIEQIGSFSHNETAVDIGILTSLIVPSEAMWKMASYAMQPPAIRSLPVSPFSLATTPSAGMLIYSVVYVVVLLLLALRSFSRRDL